MSQDPDIAEFYTTLGQHIWCDDFARRTERPPLAYEIEGASSQFAILTALWRLEHGALLWQLAQVAGTARDLQVSGHLADTREHLKACINLANTFDSLWTLPGGNFLHSYVQAGIYSNEERLAETLKALIALGTPE